MAYEEMKERLPVLLGQGNLHELKKMLEALHEADIASFLQELSADRRLLVFRLLSKDLASEVFAYMDTEQQKELLLAFNDEEIAEIIEALFVDDAVDLVEEMPAGVVRRVLMLARPETRRLINQFLQYPEDSAGSIMTAEYIGLKRHMTVAQAITYIRCRGEAAEQLYTCYVTNAERVIEGVISLRTLLMSPDDTVIAELMSKEVITGTTTDDREEIAKKIQDYDLLALPIIDHEKRLVGVVTVDDALDVIREEAEEDFEKMAAMSPTEKPYLKMTIWEQVGHRLPWLLVLMISGMLNGAILSRYEAAFLLMPVLVTFIPMLSDTGGNAGSQSSTLVIRGLALGELSFRDFWRIIWIELRVSLLAGTVLAVVNFARVFWLMGESFIVALVVSIALIVTVVLSKIVGGALPVLATFVRLDPAIMAAPLITTIVDAGAFFIYFSLATTLLGI
jgi:magnesium transporter